MRGTSASAVQLAQLLPHHFEESGKKTGDLNAAAGSSTTATSTSKRVGKHGSSSHFIGTPDHQHNSGSHSKSGKVLPTSQSAYYTVANTGKHLKSDSVGGVNNFGVNSGLSSYKRHAAHGDHHSSNKRSVQSAHSGASHGSVGPSSSSVGRDNNTPKTPSMANTVFRRKWGGVSSTKSVKSVSSNRSAAAPPVAIGNFMGHSESAEMATERIYGASKSQK